MDRILHVMNIMNKNIMLVNDMGYVFDDGSFDEIIHTYGVAYMTAATFHARKLNAELGFVIGLLHDIGRIANDDYTKGHGLTGALMAERILKDSGLFDEDEIQIAYRCISRHSKKKDVDEDVYLEALKDADALERIFFLKEYGKSDSMKRKRIKDLLADFSLRLDEEKINE